MSKAKDPGFWHPKNATRPLAQLDTPEECNFATKHDRTMGGTTLYLAATPLKNFDGMLKCLKNVRFENEYP